MPYTPPSSRSPAASAPTSPDISRRSSFHLATTGSTRPTLPRSASYMSKHRRTPSAPSVVVPRPVSEPSPESTSEDLAGMVANMSVRQSPPPVTGDRRMPNGAIISPPDSCSDDDESPDVGGQDRGRKREDLKALQQAIRQIPQDRSSSPSRETEKSKVDGHVTLPSQAASSAEGIPHSLSIITPDDALATGGSRRFSHMRSATEPNLQFTLSGETSLTGSQASSDEEGARKPQMVRKKSGELVRPALRPPSRRRPSSMPGTPTYSKAVHFDSHLEHVRHFLQVDRPAAVSAGSSPNDQYDSDVEYPFGGVDRPARSPPFELEIVMHNFPIETPTRRALPVQLERVWLSADQKSLIGSVAVANLAFQKFVTCRFTLDYWKTTSEVGAEYVCEVRPADGPVPRDRFQFTIKLSDLANLESKTLYFCVRYNVNGQEYWDNNSGMNFQADFRKKMVPQNGKSGVIGAASRPINGLPKSTRRSNPSTAPRPFSMPMGADDFRGNPRPSFDQTIDDYLGESGLTSIKLKGSKSSSSIPSDNLASRLPPPSGQAFANRYDFDFSLTAAIQDAKDQLTDKADGLYMKASKKLQPAAVGSAKPAEKKDGNATKKPAPAVFSPPAPAGTASPIASSSYDEIVSKYCFFGSKQSSHGRFDGANDSTRSTNSSNTASYEGSPVQRMNYQHSHSGTQHHSLHGADYFHQGTMFGAVGASPSESPLKMTSAQQFNPTNTPRTSQAASRPSPPAVSAGNFAHLAGTSSTEYPYQHMHDRFPFSGADTHAATAIRG